MDFIVCNNIIWLKIEEEKNKIQYKKSKLVLFLNSLNSKKEILVINSRIGGDTINLPCQVKSLCVLSMGSI